MRKRKIGSGPLVCGVGVNDADYETGPKVNGKSVWCPFYRKWVDMLRRCYSRKFHDSFPKYRGCMVSEEWLYFSKFKAWMEDQDWAGKVLDKDILIRGNKVYSEETCVFVDHQTNSFILENDEIRTDLPIGVRRIPKGYQAQAKKNRKTMYLGDFDTPEEAHEAWVAFKLKLAIEFASRQTDSRVAEALIRRYENYEAV